MEMKASSRISARFGQNYYTAEFTESKVLPDNLSNEELQPYRDKLWEVVNREVDNQIEQVRILYEQSKIQN